MQKDKYPSDEAEKFMLRLPAGMRDRVASAAKAANRSMNAEVVARLEESFGRIEFMEALRQQELKILEKSTEVEKELARAQAQADLYRFMAESLDDTRTFAAKLYVDLADQLPPEKSDEAFRLMLGQWLLNRDVGGAAWSLLQLLDGAKSEQVEALRELAKQLEGAGLKRKRIELPKRVPAQILKPHPSKKAAAKRKKP